VLQFALFDRLTEQMATAGLVPPLDH